MTKTSPVEFENVLMSDDVIADIAAQNLIGRFEWISAAPQCILTWGPRDNALSNAVQSHYSEAMVKGLCGEALINHTADHSVDMIIANLILPWTRNINEMMQSWQRVMKEDGVLLLSAFGPDTGKELPAHDMQALCIDVHDLGDLLVRFGFVEPVLDVDHFTLCYNNPQKCYDELLATQMFQDADGSLKSTIAALTPLEMSYVLIFAHAFAGKKPHAQEYKFPLSKLKDQSPSTL